MSLPKHRTRLSLSELKPGIVLPAPIYDGVNANVLLLGAGTRVTSANLQRLRDRGVTSICIDTSCLSKLKEEPVSRRVSNYERKTPEKAPEKSEIEIIRERRAMLRKVPYSQQSIAQSRERMKTQSNQLEAVFQMARKRAKADSHAVHSITNEAAECIIEDLDIHVRTVLEVDSDTSSHKHCLRVGQLAMSVAAVMGFPRQEYTQLSIGCLMSRLGVAPHVQTLLEKPVKLTNVELLELHKVPIKTFEILQGVDDLSTISRQVAYQIFERHDGTGYPRGRAGNQIHPLARIASLCDTYVALTSDRPHRKAFEPYFAIEQILNETRKGRFDPNSVRGLLQTVSLFPIGSYVKLSDNSLAEVMRNSSDQYDAPVVKILASGSLTSLHEMVDLVEQRELKIESIIPGTEIAQRLQDINAALSLETLSNELPIDSQIEPDEQFAQTVEELSNQSPHVNRKSAQQQLTLF